MGLIRTGRDNLASLAASTGGTLRPWNATGAYIAVGNNTGAETAASTWLLGTSTMIGMDATYPQRTANVITYQGTFTTAMANFAWNEWGIVNATTTGDANLAMLNRKLEDPSLGTKTSAQSWQIQAAITFTT
jgi:hypothetical protein